MNIVQSVLVCVSLVAIVSCSNGEKEHIKAGVSKTSTAGSASSKKLSGVIPQYQLDALEKAKGVEQRLEEADDEMRKEIEAISK